MPNHRVARLREAMARTPGQAILVTNAYNRRYLTGFTGTSGVALISGDQAAFVTDFRYTGQAAEQAPGFRVVKHGPDMNAAVAELLREWKIESLLIEEQDVTYAAYMKMENSFAPGKLLPSEGIVNGLRAVKEDVEIDIIQEAADLADRAFEHILGFLKPGVSEKAVAFELEMFMRSNGASGTSFETIVASGERSALPHGVASDKPIAPGEFVTLDFGAYYKGYCSDITRTVVVGKASDKQKEIYSIVLEAQQHALEHLRPGMTGKEGDALTRDIIASYGYGEYFGHGTGHGIGLEIHESPRLSMTGDFVLSPGMVVTVEPGIYLPGFGGVRIEDDVVVTGEGIRILTKAPKRLIELD